MIQVSNRRLAALVVALGTTQIVSWGQLFYSMAVLWPTVGDDLGFSRTLMFVVVSLALLVNGIMSPFAGRAIDVYNGRLVMCVGSVVAALAFLIVSQAESLTVYIIGWLIGGWAMSLTMYDPAFATLSQHAGDHYRRAMTAVTLLGGLAGTVFWPLTTWLQSSLGWRGAFVAFAVMQLCICLPLHASLIPIRRTFNADGSRARSASTTVPLPTTAQARTYRWLVAAFSLHAYVMSVLAVHLLSLLQGRGLSLSEAVAVGMIIGPMQVAGRLVDVSLGDRIQPRVLGLVAFALMTAGLLLLALPNLSYQFAFVVAGLWGSGNGFVTIVKGICIAQVFGRNDYGAWMGRLARWTFCMHAVAPGSFAYFLALGLGYDTAGWLLGAFVAAGTICYWMALKDVPAVRRG